VLIDLDEVNLLLKQDNADIAELEKKINDQMALLGVSTYI